MGKFLERRRRRWYAVLDVPVKAQAAIGRKRLVKSLQTESLTVAENRVRPVIVEWKRIMEAASGASGSDLDFMESLKVAEQLGQDPRASEAAFEALFNIESGFVDAENPTEAELKSHESGWNAYEEVFNRVKLRRYVETYLSKIESVVVAKTLDMRRRDIGTFCKRFEFADEVTTKKIREWVESDLLGGRDLTTATAKRMLSGVRGFWGYLRDQDLTLPDIAWDGVVPGDKRRGAEKAQDCRQPFVREDYAKLVDAVPEGDEALLRLIRVLAHTGARIEEICSLKTTDVLKDRIRIVDAKTAAGVREIPIHRDIADLVKKMKEDSQDGFLFSGLTTNKYEHRSNAIGKRFGRLKSKIGYSEHYVAHSFRKGVARQLEEAEYPENIAARLMGHDFKSKSQTYGVYSGGVAFRKLKEAVEKLVWE